MPRTREERKCGIWFCFKRATAHMQVSMGDVNEVVVSYCEKHAKIADEMFRNGDIKVEVPYDYEPLQTLQPKEENNP